MSYQEVENLSKAELKNKLFQMGMSLDKKNHPRDYYVEMYLEKSNAKNKITRDNTPFNREQMLRGKRERQKETDKELLEDPNYVPEEFEEEEEEVLDEDEVQEESEEKEEKGQKEEKIKYSSYKKSTKKEIDEKNKDYRESGIKITRLIRKRKVRLPKNKRVLHLTEKNDEEKNISYNYEDMAGQNGQNPNYYLRNYNTVGNAQEQNINIDKNYENKNNEFYNNNLPENKNDVITLKVEKLTNDNNDNNNEGLNASSQEYKKVYYGKTNAPNEPKQNPEGETIKTNVVSFGAPKDNTQINMNLLSKGPVTFGVNQNSSNLNNQDQNDKQSKRYNFFIQNISESIKEDINENQNNNNKNKTILLKWDTPKQKEFLSASIEKEHTFRRPIDENMNDVNKINLQYKFENNDDLQGKDKTYADIPNNQIVNDSIQNTTINQCDSKKMNNDIPYNEDYKSKLRNYKKVIIEQNNPEQIDNNNINLESSKKYGKIKNTSAIHMKSDNNINPSEYIIDKDNIINENKESRINKNMNNNYNHENYEIAEGEYNIDMRLKNLDNYGVVNNNNYQKEDIEMKDINNMNNYKNEDINMNDQYNQINLPNAYNMNNANYTYSNSNATGKFKSDNSNNMKNYTNDGNNNMENKFNMNEENKYNDNNLKFYTNDGSNMNPNSNMNDNKASYIQNDNINSQNVMLDNMIKSNNENFNSTFNQNVMNENSNIITGNKDRICLTGNNQQNENYEGDHSEMGMVGNKKSSITSKKSLLKRFRNSAYMWPLIILVCLGLALLVNSNYDTFEPLNIIYCFSIIMALIIIYNIIKYFMEKRKYKKMAKEDKEKLIELLKEKNITRVEFGNHLILASKFIYSRIQYHQISMEEYIKYVYPYLEKYLKKDKLKISKEENSQSEEYNYWKEI